MGPFPRHVPLEHLGAPLSPAELRQLVLEAGFDAASYRNLHDDLAEGLDGPDAALDHFLIHGVLEGRRIPPIRTVASETNPALHRLAAAPIQNELYRSALIEALAASIFGAAGIDLSRDVDTALALAGTLERLGACPLVILGDSHAELYCRRIRGANGWIVPLHRIFWAGSARGLNNPKSRSGYGAIMRTLLNVLTAAPKWPVVLKFGQVDIEFVFAFRRIRDGALGYDPADYERFCSGTVAEYVKFLDSAVPASLRDRVFVLSISPPCLADEAWAEGYTNAHISNLESDYDPGQLAHAIKQLAVPSLLERTRIHRLFNKGLRDSVTKIGLNFIDDCDGILSPHGIVWAEHVGPKAGTDHHLDHIAMEGPVTGTLSLIVEILRRSGGTSQRNSVASGT